jgi:muramoyltetrapeptide carboxypeptidase LdcA involved in peptidoglycan recycling
VTTGVTTGHGSGATTPSSSVEWTTVDEGRRTGAQGKWDALDPGCSYHAQMHALRHPPKPSPGDAVAVLSPSAGLPAVFPTPYELGLRRLTEAFGLVPVEYPTTRRMGASPEERAADIHAAFSDPAIKAVFASIGGDDQIRVLPHLDRELLRANPKPFFGFSDNTNLLVFLWNLGIIGYHGGSIMVELGRPMSMNPQTADSLRAALFGSGPRVLTAPDRIGAVVGNWADPTTFTREPDSEPADPWTWHNPTGWFEGPTWGGNLEILSVLLVAENLAVADGDTPWWHSLLGVRRSRSRSRRAGRGRCWRSASPSA